MKKGIGVIILTVVLCFSIYVFTSCTDKEDKKQTNETESIAETTIPESERTIYNWPEADAVTLTVNGYSADFYTDKWRRDITARFCDLNWQDLPADNSITPGVKKGLTVDFNTGRAVITFTEDGKYAILNGEQYALAEEAYYYIDMLAEANP